MRNIGITVLVILTKTLGADDADPLKVLGHTEFLGRCTTPLLSTLCVNYVTSNSVINGFAQPISIIQSPIAVPSFNLDSSIYFSRTWRMRRMPTSVHPFKKKNLSKKYIGKNDTRPTTNDSAYMYIKSTSSTNFTHSISFHPNNISFPNPTYLLYLFIYLSCHRS